MLINFISYLKIHPLDSVYIELHFLSTSPSIGVSNCAFFVSLSVISFFVLLSFLFFIKKKSHCKLTKRIEQKRKSSNERIEITAFAKRLYYAYYWKINVINIVKFQEIARLKREKQNKQVNSFSKLQMKLMQSGNAQYICTHVYHFSFTFSRTEMAIKIITHLNI